MKGLQIAEGLALPLDAVTRTFGLLAVRGAGKSNAAVVIAEEMVAAGLHWVAIDPKDDWYGLRSSSDGKGPGLPVVVFGGRHADVPLEPGAGQLLADLVVDNALTCVLVTSEFTEGEKVRFLDAFADRLFRRKTDEQDPTHLFLEEADDYIPQRVPPKYAHLVYVFERLVKQGRSRGLGCTLISQRSAVVNKNVLTQVETLIALRTTSPQDRKAIEGWVEYHAQSKDILESLSGLEDGEAWIWSPQWLRTVRRIRFRRRSTYDSGATPAVGKSRRPPATLADVDLGAIKAQMAETIERAKASDPRELQRQVAELKRALAARPAAAPPQVREVERPVIDRGHVTRLETVIAALVARTDGLAERIEQVRQEARGLGQHLAAAERAVRQRTPPPPAARPAAGTLNPAPRALRATAALAPPSRRAGGLGARILAILNACDRPLSRLELGIRSCARWDTGHFGNCLSALRTAGQIEGSGGGYAITAEGRAACTAGPPPIGEDLAREWAGKLGALEREILEELIAAYPASLTREELGERTGKRADTGHFGNCLSALRSNGIVEGRGRLRVRPELVEGAS